MGRDGVDVGRDDGGFREVAGDLVGRSSVVLPCTVAAPSCAKASTFQAREGVFSDPRPRGNHGRMRPDNRKQAMSDDRHDSSVRPGTSDELDSTVQLISRARSGDQEAIDCLFARHLKPLQRWATGRLPRWARDLADTDDLVQDTLLRTFKRLDIFEARRVGGLQAYLRQAVLNRLRDELRRHGRRPETTQIDDIGDVAARSPLEEAIGRQAIDSYDEALARLKPEEREAIIARVELGYTYEEMADALGKPSAEAARKAARRALLRLAEEMNRAAA